MNYASTPSPLLELTHVNCHCSVSQHDEFVRRLIQIYTKVDDKCHQVYHIFIVASYMPYIATVHVKCLQAITFGIHRCDYMLHINDVGEIDPSAKLVEINTIAVSGFGCSQEIALIHKYVCNHFDNTIALATQLATSYFSHYYYSYQVCV